MKVRSVALAFVSSVFLVAFSANSGPAFATTNPITTQAYSALTSGDSERATALYSTAIESRTLEPEALANALLNRALAEQQLKQDDKAVEDYTSALSLDAMPANLRATALYNRGLSQQKLSLPTLAIEDFTSALLINPTFPHAYLSRAIALRDSGQYLFALSDYERAVKYKHPAMAGVYFGEALTYELLNRPSDVRKMLDAALRADANFKPAREKLASFDSLNPIIADSNDASVDPILTGSIAAVGGATLVHKPDLPKGVEPPDSLYATAALSGDTNVAEVEAPTFEKNKKLYTDRLPQSDAATGKPVAVKLSAQADEKIVAVESVPAIPPSATKSRPVAPVQAAAVQPANDNEPQAVGSTDQAEPAVSDAVPVIGWSVQIASAGSQDAAWSTWKNMQKKFKVLSDQTPVIVKADLGSKGIFFRVRIAGFDNQNGAKIACDHFRANGLSCYISKAEG